METKRTPTPWVLKETGTIYQRCLSIGSDEHGIHIAYFYPDVHWKDSVEIMEANAKFALMACNVHEKLVAALEEIQSTAAIYQNETYHDIATNALLELRGEDDK